MSEIRRDDEVRSTTRYDPATGQPIEQVQTTTTAYETPPAAPVATSETVTTDPYAPSRVGMYRVQQLLYTILTIIEGLLLIRFVLRLLAANPASGFASFIYGLTGVLVAPFYGLFPTPAAGNGSVLELYTLVALIVYPLIFWVLVRLLWLALGEERTSVVTKRVDTRRIEPPL